MHHRKRMIPFPLIKKKKDVCECVCKQRKTLEGYQRNVSIPRERRAGYQGYFRPSPTSHTPVMSDRFVVALLQ